MPLDIQKVIGQLQEIRKDLDAGDSGRSKEEIDQLKSELRDLSNKLKKATADLEAEKSRHEKTKSQKDTADKARSDLSQRITELQAEIRDLSSKVREGDRHEARAKDLQTRIDNRDGRISDLKAENSGLKAEVKDLSTRLHAELDAHSKTKASLEKAEQKKVRRKKGLIVKTAHAEREVDIDELIESDPKRPWMTKSLLMEEHLEAKAKKERRARRVRRGGSVLALAGGLIYTWMYQPQVIQAVVDFLPFVGN